MSQCGSRPVVTGPAGEHITASNPGVLSFNHWGLPPVDMFAVVLNSQPPVHVFNSRQQYTQWIATHNLSQGMLTQFELMSKDCQILEFT